MKNKKRIIFYVILIVTPLYVCSETITGLHDGYRFSIVCKSNDEACDFYVTHSLKNINYKTKISVNAARTGLVWYGDNILEIIQGFGPNTHDSIFFDYKKMRLSDFYYPDVIAVDPKHHLVAYSEDNVMVKPIFNNQVKPYEIKRNFDGPPSISAWRSSSYFTPDGNLVLDYMAIENNEPVSKTECISLPGTLLNEE